MSDLVIQGLNKRFGEKRVLEAYSATIRAGRVTCVMGPSGCGKTTLLHILMGLEQADSGTITGLPERISAVFQEDRLCEDFSAVSNIRLVTGKTVSEDEIMQCLSAFGLAGSEQVPVRELSGGMKRRVAIARAVLAEGELLILDEPFKGLDEAVKEKAIALFRQSARQALVLFSTHDRGEAVNLADQVLLLSGPPLRIERVFSGEEDFPLEKATDRE